jgi:hypothetical protein
MKPIVRVLLAEPILEKLPDDAANLAAVVRQLFRAREAGDQVASWLALSNVCSRLISILGDELATDSSWYADGRWIDHIARRQIGLESPECIRVTASVLWGLAEDVGGRQWVEPFAAELRFQPGFARLANCAIQFADRRVIGEESLPESIARISQDIESGVIDWKYEFHRSFDSNAESDLR